MGPLKPKPQKATLTFVLKDGSEVKTEGAVQITGLEQSDPGLADWLSPQEAAAVFDEATKAGFKLDLITGLFQKPI